MHWKSNMVRFSVYVSPSQSPSGGFLGSAPKGSPVAAGQWVLVESFWASGT